MALSKNAQRSMWEARRAGATPEETLAYCLKRKAEGLQMESEADLAAHIAKMGEYKERPGAGGWVKKAQVLKVDPIAEARKQVQAAVDAKAITAEQAETLTKEIDAKEKALQEAKQEQVLAHLGALIQAL